MNTPDLSPLRAQFPALQETGDDGLPFVFFDGPAGTQVPRTVIDAVSHHYATANALAGGSFVVSRRCAEIVDGARAAIADFFNAPSPGEIVFGPNMTTLTYAMSRAIGRYLKPGDEIVVTALDHSANVSPWRALEERGIVVREARIRNEDCTLDLEHLASLVSAKTRVVAVGYASNLVGTINPIPKIAEIAHARGAWLYVDAVHYAPHGPIDVQADGCDVLVASIYKFFGPHAGVLWAKREILETVEPYRVEPSDPEPPHAFESGMLDFEALAGTIATIDYLATVGREYGAGYADALQRYGGRRRELKQALHAMRDYERSLVTEMVAGLRSVPGITIYGITDPARFDERCPTVSFRLEGLHPLEISRRLGERNIFTWDGNNYAIGITRSLGIEDSGGTVRAGITHYNTRHDVERLLAAVREMA